MFLYALSRAFTDPINFKDTQITTPIPTPTSGPKFRQLTVHELQMCSSSLTAPWRPHPLSAGKMRGKMWKNAQKALCEHLAAAKGEESRAYAPLEKALPEKLLSYTGAEAPLQFTTYSPTSSSSRSSSETVHLCLELPQGLLACIFDGLHGKKLAEFAKTYVERHFKRHLDHYHDLAHPALEEMFHQIHIQSTPLHKQGATSVVCYINKNTQEVYTATLGPCEATIYRSIDQKLQSIPLSCVRNWASVKDACRASQALDAPSILVDWPQQNPKKLRFPLSEAGVSFSRALGEQDSAPAISHKPKISLNQVCPGDIIILTSNEIKSVINEKEIHQLIGANPPNLAQHLVDLAFEKGGPESATALAIKT